MTPRRGAVVLTDRLTLAAFSELINRFDSTGFILPIMATSGRIARVFEKNQFFLPAL